MIFLNIFYKVMYKNTASFLFLTFQKSCVFRSISFKTTVSLISMHASENLFWKEKCKDNFMMKNVQISKISTQ